MLAVERPFVLPQGSSRIVLLAFTGPLVPRRGVATALAGAVDSRGSRPTNSALVAKPEGLGRQRARRPYAPRRPNRPTEWATFASRLGERPARSTELDRRATLLTCPLRGLCTTFRPSGRCCGRDSRPTSGATRSRRCSVIGCWPTHGHGRRRGASRRLKHRRAVARGTGVARSSVARSVRRA